MLGVMAKLIQYLSLQTLARHPVVAEIRRLDTVVVPISPFGRRRSNRCRRTTVCSYSIGSSSRRGMFIVSRLCVCVCVCVCVRVCACENGLSWRAQGFLNGEHKYFVSLRK